MKRKLWFRIAILFLIGIILPLMLLFSIINGMIYNYMHEFYSQKIQNDLALTSASVDNILDGVQYSLGPIWADSRLQHDLQRLEPYDERVDISDFRRTRDILESMNESLTRNIFIFSLDLYSVRGQTMFSTSGLAHRNILNNYELSDSVWYQCYRDADTRGGRWSSLCHVYEDEPQLIKFYPIFSDAGKTLDEIYSVSVNRQAVRSCISTDNFTPNSSFFILDNDNRLFMETGALSWDALQDAETTAVGLYRIPAVKIGGTDYYSYRYTSPNSGLQYLFLIPIASANNHNTISTFYVLTSVIILVLVVLFAFFIALHYGVHPVIRLFNAMQKVEQGDFEVRLPEERTDEVGAISLHFNQMVSQLDTLIKNNIAIKAHEKDLELKFILSQLNEHFLYNTLDSIHWSAMQQHNDEICKVVSKLSKFYRNSLSNGNDIISVSQVQEIIESYLYVQKFRMQERLSYHIETDPELLSCQVLKYLFQPLVENAILHGVSCKAKGGHVDIQFTRQDDLLRFSVTDTGYGISQEKLEEIRAQIASPDSTDTCFALKNVNSQLAYFYGSQYHVHIESSEGIGTRVWFCLPISN